MNAPRCTFTAAALLCCATLCLLGTACRESASKPSRAEALDSPAPPGASQPHLAAHGDRLYLSWLEQPAAGATRLRFAVLGDGRWSEPRTIASDGALLVNWADFPALRVDASGRLAAHWLVRNPAETFAYDVNVSVSTNAGEDWAAPFRPHADGTPTEHGFVSLVSEADGSIGVVWLDGRAMATGGGTMRLMYRRWDGATAGPEVVLDDDVCTCCQTSAARSGDTLLVVYRDHEPGQIRDISLLRREGAEWSPRQTIHHDGWEIAGCPVNGPAVAVAGDDAAVAWFTVAAGRARVQLTRSNDLGRTLSEPLRLDGGDPIGRVDLELAEDGTALVSWIERTPDGAEVRVRKAGPDGSLDPPWLVGRADGGRPSGFPRMARVDGRVFVAWTDPGPPSRIRLASLPF